MSGSNTDGVMIDLDTQDDFDIDISFDFGAATKVEKNQSEFKEPDLVVEESIPAIFGKPAKTEPTKIEPEVPLADSDDHFKALPDLGARIRRNPGSANLGGPIKREQPLNYSRDLQKPRMSDMEKKLPIIRVMKEEGSQTQSHKPFLTPKGERYFLHALFYLIDYSKRTSPLRMCYHCFSMRHKDFRKPNDVKFISTGLIEIFEGVELCSGAPQPASAINGVPEDERKLRERWNKMLCQSGGFLEDSGMIRRVPVQPGESGYVDLDEISIDTDDINGGYKIDRSEFKKKLDLENGYGDGLGWILGANERLEYRLPSFGRCTGIHKEGSRCKYRSYYRINDDLDGRGESVVGQGKKASPYDGFNDTLNPYEEAQAQEDSFITGAYTVKDVVRQIADNSYSAPVGLREERRREKMRLLEAEQTLRSRQKKLELLQRSSVDMAADTVKVTALRNPPQQFQTNREHSKESEPLNLSQDPETMSVSMSISVRNIKEAPPANYDNRSEIGKSNQSQNEDLLQKNLKKMRKLSKKLKKSKMMGQTNHALASQESPESFRPNDQLNPYAQETQNLYAQSALNGYSSNTAYSNYYDYYQYGEQQQNYLGKRQDQTPAYSTGSRAIGSSSSYQARNHPAEYNNYPQYPVYGHGPDPIHRQPLPMEPVNPVKSQPASYSQMGSLPVAAAPARAAAATSQSLVVPDEFKAFELLGISLQTSTELKQQTASKMKKSALFGAEHED